MTPKREASRPPFQHSTHHHTHPVYQSSGQETASTSNTDHQVTTQQSTLDTTHHFHSSPIVPAPPLNHPLSPPTHSGPSSADVPDMSPMGTTAPQHSQGFSNRTPFVCISSFVPQTTQHNTIDCHIHVPSTSSDMPPFIEEQLSIFWQASPLRLIHRLPARLMHGRPSLHKTLKETTNHFSRQHQHQDTYHNVNDHIRLA
jgi:hypothetical protein